jgi:hypothetical protein
MGTWGHGHFEDDTAFDFMAEVEESDDPKKIFNDAFDFAISVDYLEFSEANAVIVSAAYVDGQINGTKFSSPADEDPLEVDSFPNRHPDLDFTDLKEKSVLALQKVLNDNSELNELWAENEELYPVWRLGIEQVIERLRN